MSEFYADPAVGGDDSRTTDDDNPTTGLANGGFWTRLVPMFANVVAIANYVRERATIIAQQSQIASNAAVTAVDAANSAVAKATIPDSNPVVQGAADGTKFVRLDTSTLVKPNTTVVLVVPAVGGTLVTAEAVTALVNADTQRQRARRAAAALAY